MYWVLTGIANVSIFRQICRIPRVKSLIPRDFLGYISPGLTQEKSADPIGLKHHGIKTQKSVRDPGDVLNRLNFMDSGSQEENIEKFKITFACMFI